MPLEAGTRLGPYELVDVLGAGGIHLRPPVSATSERLGYGGQVGRDGARGDAPS